ncbi:uncharacterized protein LOC122533313 [Frieseomelitta varia]|uniref:uncharacterized protein LOC122533313 n=1 Tax=Frieseomelitta varia TaxID=561572 RepID=UPI001CB685CE|nr:uncharacterized protein LOC122533313 [Frieseomelitta varia]
MDHSGEMKRTNDVVTNRPRIIEYSSSIRSRTSRRTTTPSSALIRSEFESLISESSDEDEEAPASKLARLSLPKIGNNATNPKEADTVVFEDMDEARLTATFTLSSHSVIIKYTGLVSFRYFIPFFSPR